MSKTAEQKKKRREQIKNAGATYRAKKAAEGKVRVSLWVDSNIASYIKKIIKSKKTKNAEICGLAFIRQDIYLRRKNNNENICGSLIYTEIKSESYEGDGFEFIQ